MRESSIVVEPYEFVDIMEMNIDKKANEHATAKIVGHISEEHEDKYVEMAGNNEWMSIKAKDEQGNEEVIFTGIVNSVAVNMINNVRTLEVNAISGSSLMDINQNSRTFQDANQSYESILNTLVQNYDRGGVYMAFGENETIKDMVVQYKETDWQFAKRLASQLNIVIFPECKMEGVKIYFGIPDLGEEISINPNAYSLKKDIGEYMYKTQNKVDGITENDSIYYEVMSREIHGLCQSASFKGRKLNVYEVNSRLEGAVLIHTYSFKTRNGFKTNKQFNEKLIGASIGAKVLEVQKDRVKVQMEIDDVQDVGTAKWLPYSTVYSSPDGSGWYCMPEMGDSLRVYFADEKEGNAFVISAVHEQSSNAEKRSDPNVKALSTKYGKEIIFSEKELTIKNGDAMTIVLSDDNGITITSDKDININAAKDMYIAATESVLLDSSKCITFKQGENNKIEINDNITLAAQQVKME